jgi:pyrroline-5-carboxylate reductase
MNKKIVFLGAGKMGEALIGAFIGSRAAYASRITAVDADAKRLNYLKKRYNIGITADKRRALKNARIVFLAVKPQQMQELLDEIRPYAGRKTLFISIAAGLTTKYLENNLPKGAPVIRTMPNTPAMVGLGAAGIAKGRRATAVHIRAAKRLLDNAGITAVLPENKLNAVTAVSGSGPAYVFFLAEMLERSAVELGLSKDVAAKLARQTVAGAGRMLERSEATAAQLRKNVTSPGGTTEAALKVLGKKEFYSIFSQAVKRAAKRSRELSK